MRTSSTIMTRRQRAPWRRGTPWYVGSLLAIFTIAGCDSVPPVATFEPTTDPGQLFMSLRLNHRAINLSTVSPYDTFQLVATPRNGLGEPISGLPAPTFRSNDTTRVWVTEDGKLEARQAGSRIQIIAEILTEDNIRRADTAYVTVTTDPSPPKLATFSIQPESPAAAVWPLVANSSFLGATILRQAGIDYTAVLPLRILDENGDPIVGLQIELESLDPEVIGVNNIAGSITGPFSPGEARIVARTMAYGVEKADTATYKATLAAYHVVLHQLDLFTNKVTFGPTDVIIRQNGYVFWANFVAGTPMDITFDDPTNVADMPEVCAAWGGSLCGSGNIPAFESDMFSIGTLVGRRFPVPGTYEYKSELTGYRGRIIVVAEDSPS